jgi:hypothetical protein
MFVDESSNPLHVLICFLFFFCLSIFLRFGFLGIQRSLFLFFLLQFLPSVFFLALDQVLKKFFHY